VEPRFIWASIVFDHRIVEQAGLNTPELGRIVNLSTKLNVPPRPLSGTLPIYLITIALLSVATFIDTVGAGSSTIDTSQQVGEVDISLIPFTTVPFSPVDIANSGLQDDARLFIVQQNGVIQVALPDGTIPASPFLDIRDRVNGGSEMGLLGLVFDPDYRNNDFFFVNYTHIDGNDDIYTRISRFEVTADPELADPTSELIIYSVQQPFSNHNAGDLNFGPDGYLYFGLGDGGSGGDPGNRAQNPQNPLGKMIRIDVTGTTSTTNYLIPQDNPYVDDPGILDEIWSLGLRNPWRFSFDRLTGDMYIADVGQNTWEEIDFQPSSTGGGENWGWRCYEGNATYNTSGCGPAGQYDFPIHVYNHSEPGCSVTGGYVYRGSQYPGLFGRYLFADYCFGQIWSLEFNGTWQLELLGSFNAELFTSFGENVSGEMYIASSSNNMIYRIVLPGDAFLPLLYGG
jgi:glucose/arabinose dehydrogenase